ncbi:MAG: hypothetical protein RLZZ118_2079 [Bacteroidota bacterium]|jgi:hypothetical protein
MQISIPNPCSENWNAMLPEYDGRFCNKCQHTVVDFSGMSDSEVIAYIKKNPFIACGNFRIEQVNRPLYFTKKAHQKIAYAKAKVAALILFLLSTPKQIFSQVISSNRAIENKIPTDSATITNAIISGTITNANNEPFGGVQILFDEVEIMTTNAEGNFSFSPNTFIGQHRIQFKANESRFKTISYHNAAGSQHYTVSLDTAKREYYAIDYPRMGGIPAIPFINAAYHIGFKKNTSTLTKESIADINDLCMAMRNNPSSTIYPTLFYTNAKTKLLAIKRMKAFEKAMLTNGIDIDRLDFELTQNDVMIDSIQFGRKHQ